MVYRVMKQSHYTYTTKAKATERCFYCCLSSQNEGNVSKCHTNIYPAMFGSLSYIHFHHFDNYSAATLQCQVSDARLSTREHFPDTEQTTSP